MKFLTAVLVVSGNFSHAVARALRSGIAVLDAAGRARQPSTLNFDIDLAGCDANPSACASLVGEMQNLTSTSLKESMDVLNMTKKDIDLFMQNCTYQSVSSAVSQLANKHTECRRQEHIDQNAKSICEQSLETAKDAKNTECEHTILKKRRPDTSICKANEVQGRKSIATYVEGVMKKLRSDLDDYTNQSAKCQTQKDNLSARQRDFTDKKDGHTEQKQKCDNLLKTLQEDSCNFATESADRWTAYVRCRARQKKEIPALKSKIETAVEAVKEQYKAAKAMGCMSKAIDSSGSVSVAKVKECKAEAIDTKHINVTSPVLPAEVTFQRPTVFPGSLDFQELVGGSLPKGWQVTPCLAWRSTCAAKSTFNKSAVYLKSWGFYCTYSETYADQSKGFKCAGRPGAEKVVFSFVHPDKSCTSSIGINVHEKDGKQLACRVKVESFVHLVCSDRALSQSPRYTVERNQEPDDVRYGKVRIRSSEALTSAVSKQARRKVDSRYNCFDQFSNSGAIAHIKMTSMPYGGNYDLKGFDTTCRKIPGEFAGQSQYFAVKADDPSPTVECPKAWVMRSFASVYSSSHKARKWWFDCVKMDRRVELRNIKWHDRTRYEVGCSGDKEVMTGFKASMSSGVIHTWQARCATVGNLINFETEFAYAT